MFLIPVGSHLLFCLSSLSTPVTLPARSFSPSRSTSPVVSLVVPPDCEASCTLPPSSPGTAPGARWCSSSPLPSPLHLLFRSPPTLPCLWSGFLLWTKRLNLNVSWVSFALNFSKIQTIITKSWIVKLPGHNGTPNIVDFLCNVILSFQSLTYKKKMDSAIIPNNYFGKCTLFMFNNPFEYKRTGLTRKWYMYKICERETCFFIFWWERRKCFPFMKHWSKIFGSEASLN